MATRILAMNDEQDILDLFRDLLEDVGYEVFLYSYAPREVEEVVRVQPDLIVLDLMFGNENHGWQLLQKLRMTRATCRIPVVVCTAMTRREYELESYLNSQGVALVPKPFDIDVFLGTIAQLLELREHLPALLDDAYIYTDIDTAGMDDADEGQTVVVAGSAAQAGRAARNDHDRQDGHHRLDGQNGRHRLDGRSPSRGRK